MIAEALRFHMVPQSQIVVVAADCRSTPAVPDHNGVAQLAGVVEMTSAGMAPLEIGHTAPHTCTAAGAAADDNRRLGSWPLRSTRVGRLSSSRKAVAALARSSRPGIDSSGWPADGRAELALEVGIVAVVGEQVAGYAGARLPWRSALRRTWLHRKAWRF